MWSQIHLMMEWGSCLVKTDWNCLSKMSAFDLLSLWKLECSGKFQWGSANVILAFQLDVPPEWFRIVLGKPFLGGDVYKVPFRLAEESFSVYIYRYIYIHSLWVPVVCPRSHFSRLPIKYRVSSSCW